MVKRDEAAAELVALLTLPRETRDKVLRVLDSVQPFNQEIVVPVLQTAVWYAKHDSEEAAVRACLKTLGR